MHEAVWRIEPGGVYGEATANTDATIELWCNDHCDLLHVRGEDDGGVLTAIEDEVGVRDRTTHEGRMLAITRTCLREQEGTIERHLERHGCLLVPPLRYARGAKFCRVLALDAADLTGLYRDLTDEYEVSVESKRTVGAPTIERPVPTPATLLPDLSRRQREALTVATEGGYYRIPRKTTTEEIADTLGIERRTAEEHLRRAENKLVDAVIEYVGAGPVGLDRTGG